VEMSPNDCRDRVRLHLSDKTGVLRFESFDIVDAPQCEPAAEALRRYLASRPLADVDVQYIKRLSCPGNAFCFSTIAKIIEDYQSIFVHDRD